MTYALAQYLAEPTIVESVRQAITIAYKNKDIVRGSDILAELDPIVPKVLKRAIVMILKDESVLRTEKSSPEIEECLFSIDLGAMEVFFQKQTSAAAVIKETNLKIVVKQEPIGIVATFPDDWTRISGVDPTDETIRRIIIRARKDLWIVSPYFDDFGKRAIEDSLVGAASKHVHIKVIGRELSQSDLSDNRNSILALTNLEQRFRKLKLTEYLEIREFTSREPQTGQALSGLHSKIVIGDSNNCYIGSANLTRGSLSRNFELGVELHGDVVKPVILIAERIWNESVGFSLFN
jgi:phosphatidylserine/phosphatidylglycerophosphate/cardiolipin synthase-like enzyme